MHLVTTIIKNTLTFAASNVKKHLTYLPSKTWIGIGLGETQRSRMSNVQNCF